MIECQHCGKLYTRRDNFLRHLKTIHDPKHDLSIQESNSDKEVATPDTPKNEYKPTNSFHSLNFDPEYVRTAREAIQAKFNALKQSIAAENDQRSSKPTKRRKSKDDIDQNNNSHKRQREYCDDKENECNKFYKDLDEKKDRYDHVDEFKNNKINEDYDDASEDYDDASEDDDDGDYTSEDDYNFDSDGNENIGDDDSSEHEVEIIEPNKRTVYWNNPTKLINRFRELVANEQGGEIAKIVTELRKHSSDELCDMINNLPEDIIKMKSKMRHENLMRDIAEVTRSIREKQRGFKLGNIEKTAQLESIFKPITNPLKELITKVEYRDGFKLEPKEENHNGMQMLKEELKDINSSEIEASASNIGSVLTTPSRSQANVLMSEDEFATPIQSSVCLEKDSSSNYEPSNDLISRYLKLYTSSSDDLDTAYGVYFKDNEWKIGDSSLIFDGPDFIIKGNKYTGTPGLYELLFMKKPVKGLYSEQDLADYQDILEATNAYKRNYDQDEQVKGNKSYKYKHIISKLIQHKGMGLMHLPKENIDYIRWEDPNDLVDRLRLLIESQRFGQGNHNSEIVSIVEELREANIIK